MQIDVMEIRVVQVGLEFTISKPVGNKSLPKLAVCSRIIPKRGGPNRAKSSPHQLQ